MDNSILKKAGEFDKDGLVKAEIEKALVALKDFRAKFPFVEKPKSIDLLVPDDIFKVTPDEVGTFSVTLNIILNQLASHTIIALQFIAKSACKLRISRACFMSP